MPRAAGKRAEDIAHAVRLYHGGHIGRTELGRVIATFRPRPLHTRRQPS